MMKTYHFSIRVKRPSGDLVTERHAVVEEDNETGSAIAYGKICRYYETLRKKKIIKDYQVTPDE